LETIVQCKKQFFVIYSVKIQTQHCQQKQQTMCLHRLQLHQKLLCHYLRDTGTDVNAGQPGSYVYMTRMDVVAICFCTVGRSDFKEIKIYQWNPHRFGLLWVFRCDSKDMYLFLNTYAEQNITCCLAACVSCEKREVATDSM